MWLARAVSLLRIEVIMALMAVVNSYGGMLICFSVGIFVSLKINFVNNRSYLFKACLRRKSHCLDQNETSRKRNAISPSYQAAYGQNERGIAGPYRILQLAMAYRDDELYISKF